MRRLPYCFPTNPALASHVMLLNRKRMNRVVGRYGQFQKLVVRWKASPTSPPAYRPPGLAESRRYGHGDHQVHRGHDRQLAVPRAGRGLVSVSQYHHDHLTM